VRAFPPRLALSEAGFGNVISWIAEPAD